MSFVPIVFEMPDKPEILIEALTLEGAEKIRFTQKRRTLQKVDFLPPFT